MAAASCHADRPGSTDIVDDQFECDEVATLKAVERRVFLEIGPMEEHFASVSEAYEAIALTDRNASDGATGACAPR